MAWSGRELGWLAGLIEGEGSFYYGGSNAQITIKMTDRDVVARAAEMLNASSIGECLPRPGQLGHKVQYTARISGESAIGWMMSLYSMLGDRRRQQIRRILAEWRSRPPKNANKVNCKRGHSLAGYNMRTRPNGKRQRTCRACELEAYGRNREALNARRRAQRRAA